MRPELMGQIDKKGLDLALVMSQDKRLGAYHRLSPGKIHYQFATTARTCPHGPMPISGGGCVNTLWSRFDSQNRNENRTAQQPFILLINLALADFT